MGYGGCKANDRQGRNKEKKYMSVIMTSCSFHHWWAIYFHTGAADGSGGGEVKRGRVQTIGGYMARFRCGEGHSGFGKVVSRAGNEGIKDLEVSGRGRRDGDGGRTHRCVGSTSEAMEPPFIPSSSFIFIDSFWSIDVIMIDPFIVAIGVPLPLDQVLACLLSSIVAHI